MIVASFHAPRFEKWPGANYDALLQLVDASARRLGLRHIVITDAPRAIVPGGRALEHFQCALPENLMLAILEGQRQFLAQASEPVLLIGADCLLTRDPRPFLEGDLTITIGPFTDCEMNTGAIWCRDGALCEPVWRAARDRCPGAWGDDQTSLYAAIRESRLWTHRVRCEAHNWAPASAEDPAGMPTVAHFRGHRKTFMAQWGRRHLGI